MLRCALKTRTVAGRHVTAAVLLIAVLALPFHFHVFAPTAKVAPECSCYQGTRTYAVALSATPDSAPLVQVWALHHEQPEFTGRIAFEFLSIRAPPPVS